MQQLRNASWAVRARDPIERPLSARSVIASLLLGRSPARASSGDLVRWCGLFGIAPGTARVALHRMVAAGELDRGERAYELSGRLAGRQEEQRAGLAGQTRRWDGAWRMAVVTAERRPAGARAALRTGLRGARLAEWREGVWLRPDNLDLVEDPRCEWLEVVPERDPVALAAELFAPAVWARRARTLAASLDVVTEELAAGDEGLVRDAFVYGAAAVRHLRADPLLPTALVPAGWPGRELRDGYRRFQRAFDRAAQDWFRTTR
ncbi:MAG: PaaX domain-containing protein, C- domain protein [Actinobacteria bacterium]|nr:PaaX domain-containing protein, C- domain protein [Actinomycetota bacterium]